MLTRENRKNGDKLSILGFGCLRLPTKTGGIDEPKAIALIRSAIDQGVNYFDTAYFYHAGKSEALLGDALSGGYRERVKIATKLPPFMVSKLEGAQKIFETQCARLRTNDIDYYLLHMLSDVATLERMKDIGVMDWLEQLKREGRIKNLGFSFHGGRAEFEKLIRAYPWDFCQIQYNYMDENNQAGKAGLELAGSLGIPVIVMEPLRGGKLANNLPEEVVKEFRAAHPEWTPVEWAFRWIWNHPEVNVILSGMNEEAQLAENIAIAADATANHGTANYGGANSLTDAELAVFDRVKRIMLERTKIPCTGCAYCMPCPFGVDIPGCFAAYNEKYLLNTKRSRFKYMQALGVLSKKPGNASLCRECGRCEQHCPQNIQIRSELKTVKKEMEGILFKPIAAVTQRVMRMDNKK